MNNSVKRLPQVALIVALALLSLAAGDDTSRYNTIGHKLICPCGACNQLLLDCNHLGCSYSSRMRVELAAAIKRGENDDLILQDFVQKYGATVLAAPTTTGFNLVAWIIPFVALGVGTALAVWVVRAWKRRLQTAPVGTGSVTTAELDALRQRAREETEI